MRRQFAGLFAATVIAGPSYADEPGRHVEQLARLEQLSQYVAVAPMCERMGYHYEEAGLDQLQEAALAEAVEGGMSHGEAKATLRKSLNRQLRILNRSIDGAQERLGASGQYRKELEEIFSRVAPRCADAARDPLFSSVLTAPDKADLARLRRAALDELLAPAGQASWQTPAIVARAELLYAAGACRGHLSPPQLASYTAGYVGGPEPTDPGRARVRRYYADQYARGIESAAEADLDAAQCARTLADRKAKLAPPKSKPAPRKK